MVQASAPDGPNGDTIRAPGPISQQTSLPGVANGFSAAGVSRTCCHNSVSNPSSGRLGLDADTDAGRGNEANNGKTTERSHDTSAA